MKNHEHSIISRGYSFKRVGRVVFSKRVLQRDFNLKISNKPFPNIGSKNRHPVFIDILY